MLSSYGPFKDKPSLPNFEDQSFEEIRWLCYEAKNNGILQTLLPQLSQQVADASYKVSMLCDHNHVNNNLLNMLVNLYNSDTTGNTQGSVSTGSGNPFAISSAVGGGQTSSLFGTNTNTNPQPQQNPFGSSLFGSTAAPTSSIFGGGSSNTGNSNSTTNSFFGQQTPAFGTSGTSVFGGQNAFGGGAANSFGTSSFGQPSASPFSLSQIAQPTDASKPAGVFGASPFQQTQNSIFGAAPAFGNQIQPTKPSGLFSSPSTNSAFGQTTVAPASLFGQTNNQPANTGNLFSSFGASTQLQPQPQGLFGAASENKSLFGQSANSNTGMFGATTQQQNVQSSNIFANALQQQSNNAQSIFGTQHQQQSETQPNIFDQSTSNTGGSNIFQNQANNPAMGTGAIFGGNSGFGQQQEQVNENAFSKLEDLKPEDLQWFQASAFVLGKIPTVPPPKELCV